MNPLKHLRLQSHLTQQELADKIGVTRQIVIDTEQGLFSVVPPSVAQTCPRDIQELYKKWVREERRRNLDRFAIDLSLVHRFTDYVEKVGGSTRGFCRVLVIQTSVVRDYIAKNERWSMIESALSETGVPPDMIQWLGDLPRC